MKIQKVALVINPASGQDFPILAVANRFFHDHSIEWIPYITQKAEDAEQFTHDAIAQAVDVVVAYGGDGTIMEIARGLMQSSLPLAILPGGTANVIAKEFTIPLQVEKALDVLLEDNHQLYAIDTFTANGILNLLRANTGFFADIVAQAPRSAKDSMGYWAYVFSGFKQMNNIPPAQYNLQLDNQEAISLEGMGVIVTNLAHMGMFDWKYHPSISHRDGMLDVLVLSEATLASLTTLATESLAKQFPSVLSHYQAKKLHLTVPKDHTVVLDDETVVFRDVEFEIRPQSLQLLVPLDYKEQTQ